MLSEVLSESAYRVFMWISVAVSSVFFLPALFLHWRYLDKWPLNQRMPRLTLVQGVVIYVYITCFAAPHEYVATQAPCTVVLLVFALVQNFLFQAYIYRAAALLVQYELTAELLRQGVDRQAGKRPSLQTDNWFVAHHHWLDWSKVRRVLPLCLLWACVTPIWGSFLALRGWAPFQPCETDPHGPHRWLFDAMVLQLGLYLPLLTLLAYQLHKQKSDDPFFIRKELRLSAVVIGLYFLVYFLFVFFKIPNTTPLLIPVFWWTLVALVIVYPLHLCLQTQSRVKPASTTSDKLHAKVEDEVVAIQDLGLDEVLRDAQGWSTFLVFAESEFSTENVLFWDAVRQLQRCWKEVKRESTDAGLAPPTLPPTPARRPSCFGGCTQSSSCTCRSSATPVPGTPDPAEPQELLSAPLNTSAISPVSSVEPEELLTTPLSNTMSSPTLPLPSATTESLRPPHGPSSSGSTTPLTSPRASVAVEGSSRKSSVTEFDLGARVAAQARNIYQLYIDDQSPHLVNLPHNLTHQLHDDFNALSRAEQTKAEQGGHLELAAAWASMFNRAQAEILELMQNDVYLRYRTSADGLAVCKRLVKERAPVRSLQAPAEDDRLVNASAEVPIEEHRYPPSKESSSMSLDGPKRVRPMDSTAMNGKVLV